MKMTSRRRKQPKKQDGFLLVVIAQMTLCFMMVAGAFIMSSNYSTTIKVDLTDLTNRDAEVLEVFKSQQSEFDQDLSLKERLRAIVARLIGGKGGEQPKNVAVDEAILSATPIMPTKGYISSGFGVRTHPISRKTDFHTGIDIAAPQSQTIVAAYPGEVLEVGQSMIYGNFVILSHNNVKTKYAHCENVNVKVGTKVRQGEKIATVGSTGISTGPHLHFEIILKDTIVNPMTALNLYEV